MGEVMKVTHETLVDLARQAKASGRFFSAEVVKRTNGEYRIFRGLRGGVVAHTTGQGLAFNPDKKGLLVVWEAQNPDGDTGHYAYRMIAIEGLRALVIDGTRFELV
jgi:hypothetical protein